MSDDKGHEVLGKNVYVGKVSSEPEDDMLVVHEWQRVVQKHINVENTSSLIVLLQSLYSSVSSSLSSIETDSKEGSLLSESTGSTAAPRGWTQEHIRTLIETDTWQAVIAHSSAEVHSLAKLVQDSTTAIGCHGENDDIKSGSTRRSGAERHARLTHLRLPEWLQDEYQQVLEERIVEILPNELQTNLLKDLNSSLGPVSASQHEIGRWGEQFVYQYLSKKFQSTPENPCVVTWMNESLETRYRLMCT